MSEKKAPSGWHYHTNGGGLVQDTARVYESAVVSGSAVVSESAVVSGFAIVSEFARVSGFARVFGAAVVSGSARVYGSARVSGSAVVSESARVSGSARVYGSAWPSSPLYIQGSRHPLYTPSHGRLRIGCEDHTIAEWVVGCEKIATANGYTESEIEEYAMYIAIAAVLDAQRSEGD